MFKVSKIRSNKREIPLPSRSRDPGIWSCDWTTRHPAFRHNICPNPECGLIGKESGA
jgi:hypothetical protein